MDDEDRTGGVTMAISNCGHDERGKYSGGQAGDQTGGEYAVIPYYQRPWTCVLRYPNKDIAQEIASIARAAALNDRIGYDQNDRLSYYKAIRAADWRPENIYVDVETDCSASTAAAIIAAGNIHKNIKLRDLSPSLTTKNMRKALTAAGFSVFVDASYTNEQTFLLPGDILLCENHHTAVNLDKGDGDFKYLQVAQEVKAGQWGNGTSRKNALTEAGWDYARVQAMVNLISW